MIYGLSRNNATSAGLPVRRDSYFLRLSRLYNLWVRMSKWRVMGMRWSWQQKVKKLTVIHDECRVNGGQWT